MKIQLTQQEIRTALNLPSDCEIEIIDDSTTDTKVIGNTITVTFPELTAKEIVDQCKNKTEGGKLLYGDWYKNEDFYTKEQARPGTRVINLELFHINKSWNEIQSMGVEDNMLNFTEVVYLLREYKEFRELLRYSSDKSAWWTWTKSRDSDGRLVSVGDFDGDGADVGRRFPDSRRDILGVSGTTAVK